MSLRRRYCESKQHPLPPNRFESDVPRPPPEAFRLRLQPAPESCNSDICLLLSKESGFPLPLRKPGEQTIFRYNRSKKSICEQIISISLSRHRISLPK